jgi:hypothetical protein
VRTPRGAAASLHAPGRRLRRGGGAVAMAAGDDEAMARAKAAAQSAEKGLFGGDAGAGGGKGALDDSKLQALLKKGPESSRASADEKAKERMETFEAQLKEVRDTAPTIESKKELDRRGVRINAAGTAEEAEEPQEVKKKSKLEEMDAKLKQVLKGDSSLNNKKRDDRLRTETGEELLYAEFAPGATISSYALSEDFDPLNPPLPSELKQKKEEAERALKGELEPDASLPMPSELASPTKCVPNPSPLNPRP